MPTFHINPSVFEFGSLRSRAETNLRAIQVLKMIETENRRATDLEKETLVKFSGWGALPQVFSYWVTPEWEIIQKLLKNLLTEEEYDAAAASTNNAHFTSHSVISAMWEALCQIGISKNPFVLEPSAGIGHFIGLMPDLNANSTAVEINGISARIMQLLYPECKTFPVGFETVKFTPNFFDLVIGNVPFGNFQVYDPSFPKSLTHSIHDYFLVKSIDLVKNNGIVALITSRYSLDKIQPAVRKHIAKQANLMCAVRLPNTAFKENAGTEVVTDILFFQKVKTPEAQPSWLTTGNLELDGMTYPLNRYFLENPHMIMGVQASTGSMYGRAEYTINGEFDRNLFCKLVSDNVKVSGQSTEVTEQPVQIPKEISNIKNGGFGFDEDGYLVTREGNTLTPIAPTSNKYYQIMAMLQIRDALKNALQVQLKTDDESEIAAAGKKLEQAYDYFVQSYGLISSEKNRKVFVTDPDYLLVRSLEKPDGTKANIFHERTLHRVQSVRTAETPNEALAVCLSETGITDWNRIAELRSSSVADVMDEFAAAGLIYKNPDGGEWDLSEHYLTGNVREKLEKAIWATQINAQYQVNVDALSNVQPKDLEPNEIQMRLGASWIPKDIIKEFAHSLFKSNVEVGHSLEIATWTVNLTSYYGKCSVENISIWGTEDISGVELLEFALNGKTPTIYRTNEDSEGNLKRVVAQDETIAARDKQQKIKEEFGTWILSDLERAHELAKIYNKIFNSVRIREYDGSHLTFPGMSRNFLRNGDLDTHQKNAVWRILQSKSTLLGHVVGAGKTILMAAAVMELRRIGMVTKPLIVVPNHLVDQWSQEFLKVYPQANLFVVDKNSFIKNKRKLAMSRIATGNYDAIVMSHRSFEFLSISDERYAAYIHQEMEVLENTILNAIEDGNKNSRIVKKLEAQKKRLEVRLKKRINIEKKDDILTFEELGVDMLLVDESDAFKNLGITTKMTRVAGLPNTESLRAFDMFMKISYLQSKNCRIVFATGTPISNTIAEMYTLQRYLMLANMKSLNIDHFDAWASNFAESVVGLELAPDGSGYRVHTRFSRFVNVPELITLLRMFGDIKTAKMLNLPSPKMITDKPVVIAVPASTEQKLFVASLVKRAERLKTEKVDPHEDNMLMITTDGRKCALDIRLVDSRLPEGNKTKVQACASKVYEIWKNTADKQLTQMVFIDMSTPSPDHFNVYGDLKQKLVRLGIPESEIAFIHDADDDADKSTMFAAMNSGAIRVLFGSTEKMGAGTNAQQKLYALHHVDAPWRPRDIEQREGRIIRPGNENKEVYIFRYVTEGSFDAYMWQTMETKHKFITQVMSGESSARIVEDVFNTALTYAEVKALASGNPLVIERVKVDAEVRKYESLKGTYQSSKWTIRGKLVQIPFTLHAHESTIAELQKDIQIRNANTSDDFEMIIGTRHFTKRTEAAEALIETIESWKGTQTAYMVRAIYRGFKIHTQPVLGLGLGLGESMYLQSESNIKHTAKYNQSSPKGTLQSIDYVLNSLDERLETEQKAILHTKKEQDQLKIELDREFDHEKKLRVLRIRQQELNEELDIFQSDRQAIEVESEVVAA